MFRIAHGCTGLWATEPIRVWERIVDVVRGDSRAKIVILLAHN